jgi:magnesium-transporting ATPase (P-type)
MLLISVFFGIYAAGSDHFARLFTDVELDLNFWQLAAMTVLGFFMAFNYWNFAVERFIYKSHRTLDNDFKQAVVQKPTYSFLDLDAERMSGVISLFALNILLVFFIVTYNYEQFYESVKTPVRLSEETHEQVNAVILSIVMSILVMMFYFKSGFNFDPKSRFMKILAKIWIVLNAVLIVSAMLKNSEYIINHGFTYKRLGVYAFLLLSLIGLALTFIKIQFRKRNIFLFNTMAWFVYATILVCSCINWGGIITAENRKRKDFALDYHRTQINFSEKQLLKYAEEKNDRKLKSEILNSEHVKFQKHETLLSCVLFYRTLPSK